MYFEIEEEIIMRKTVLVLLLAAILVMGGCVAEGGAESDKMSVVATNFVCYDFARQIGGDSADVRLLIAPGTEVHTFEPSPADILAIGRADLFVYIGGESDVWAEGILESFDEGPQAVRLMDSVDAVPEEEEGEEEEGHDHGEEEIEYDEHIWTSPKNALRMMEALRDAMMEASPEYAQEFADNADGYMAEIRALDEAFEEIVENGRVKTVVFADRFPFLYFTREYGLEHYAAYPGCAREMEPSVKTLAELIRTVRENDIRVVYTIEMSSGSIARTIAGETEAEVMEMHSCQTVTLDEFNAGETYVSLMRRNAEALKKGLE